jgi:hypothetical protein
VCTLALERGQGSEETGEEEREGGRLRAREITRQHPLKSLFVQVWRDKHRQDMKLYRL